MAVSLTELQMRIIGAVSSIDDTELLERLQRMIDHQRSGLRVLDDVEMDSILDDLRPEPSDA